MSDEKDPAKEVVTELTKPVIDELAMKLKLPFFSAFAFSWGVINWEKAVILIFSKENIYSRIDKIKSLPGLEWPIIGDWHTSTFFAPLLYSITITAITPFITLGFKRIQKWANIRIIDTQAELDHRYKSSSATELFKLEQKNKDIAIIKFDTKKLKKDFDKVEGELQTAKANLEIENGKLDGLKIDFANLGAAVSALKREFNGYESAADKVNEYLTENERHKDNLIKANKVINELEGKLQNLTSDYATLKREKNERDLHLTEIETDNELYKEGLNSIKNFMDDISAEIDVVIFKIKENFVNDSDFYISKLEAWKFELKSKIKIFEKINSIE